jgi:hypothetical protein
VKPISQGGKHIFQEVGDQEAGGLVPRPHGAEGEDISPTQARKGAAGVQRQASLKALARRLVDLQARLGTVREETRVLSAIEIERRLKPDETRRARSLRWESERLGHELKLLRQSFEALAQESRPSGRS